MNMRTIFIPMLVLLTFSNIFPGSVFPKALLSNTIAPSLSYFDVGDREEEKEGDDRENEYFIYPPQKIILNSAS
ncbi:MAG: hypothetical protein WCJ84_06265 [Candidatus Peregrinibacteria bacterium]